MEGSSSSQPPFFPDSNPTNPSSSSATPSQDDVFAILPPSTALSNPGSSSQVQQSEGDMSAPAELLLPSTILSPPDSLASPYSFMPTPRHIPGQYSHGGSSTMQQVSPQESMKRKEPSSSDVLNITDMQLQSVHESPPKLPRSGNASHLSSVEEEDTLKIKVRKMLELQRRIDEVQNIALMRGAANVAPDPTWLPRMVTDVQNLGLDPSWLLEIESASQNVGPDPTWISQMVASSQNVGPDPTSWPSQMAAANQNVGSSNMPTPNNPASSTDANKGNVPGLGELPLPAPSAEDASFRRAARAAYFRRNRRGKAPMISFTSHKGSRKAELLHVPREVPDLAKACPDKDIRAYCERLDLPPKLDSFVRQIVEAQNAPNPKASQVPFSEGAAIRLGLMPLQASSASSPRTFNERKPPLPPNRSSTEGGQNIASYAQNAPRPRPSQDPPSEDMEEQQSNASSAQQAPNPDPKPNPKPM